MCSVNFQRLRAFLGSYHSSSSITASGFQHELTSQWEPALGFSRTKICEDESQIYTSETLNKKYAVPFSEPLQTLGLLSLTLQSGVPSWELVSCLAYITERLDPTKKSRSHNIENRTEDLVSALIALYIGGCLKESAYHLVGIPIIRRWFYSQTIHMHVSICTCLVVLNLFPWENYQVAFVIRIAHLSGMQDL